MLSPIDSSVFYAKFTDEIWFFDLINRMGCQLWALNKYSLKTEEHAQCHACLHLTVPYC